jgi:type I restriction enzyme M protein
MADEQTKPPYKKPLIIPGDYAWPSFQNRDGGNLENHYRKTLVELGKSGGMLGIIFRKAQNRIQDPAKLKRLTALIDEEIRMGLDIDIKGEIYEGLLQKNAEDTPRRSSARRT